MVRWGAGLRRAVAASVLSVTAGGLASLTPAHADEAEFYSALVTYSCTGKLAADKKEFVVGIAVPKSVLVKQQLNVAWTMPSNSPFVSPGEYPKGGSIAVKGEANISTLQGSLGAVGTKKWDSLTGSTELGFPALSGGQWAPDKKGSFVLTPSVLTLDFAPSEEIINDGDGSIVYSLKAEQVEDGWVHDSGRSVVDTTDQAKDYNGDVHQTRKVDATAVITFKGTGINYITERHPEMGDVVVTLDGVDAANDKTETKDASLDLNGTKLASEQRRVQKDLWSSGVLPYGEYALTLKNKAVETRKFMLVDAFKVVTGQVTNDIESRYRTTCRPQGNIAFTVKVEESPTPTPTPTTPTPTPTTPRPTVTVTTTPPNGSSTTTSTPKPTLTVTATVTPTRATPTTPQVAVTPSGGAQTGEAPEGPSSGAGLIGVGAVMVFGSAWGGVALKRRRAAYVRGQG